MSRRDRDRNKRGRPLFLKVRADHVPRGTTRREYIETLAESIAEGYYELPGDWEVTIMWKNKPDGPWREGSWDEVLAESSRGGRGFDKAMLNYLAIMGPGRGRG